MTLGGDIAFALVGLRAAAVSRMTETVLVGRFRDGTDPVTGDPTRVLVTKRYEGVGRIRYAERSVLNTGIAGPIAVQEPFLSIPHGSPACGDGDEVEVLTSTDDPILIGRRYKIQGSARAGQTTAHRYLLQEPS